MSELIFEDFPYSNSFDVLSKLSSLDWPIFLDSSRYDIALGRYSFIGVDPFLKIIVSKDSLSCNGEVISKISLFTFISDLLKKYKVPLVSDVPPFQGGLLGYFSYDICQHIEKINDPAIDDMKFPDAIFGVYDLIIAFDHTLKKSWIISTGFSADSNVSSHEHAKERVSWLKQQLTTSFVAGNDSPKTPFSEPVSGFTKEEYINAVEAVKEYILDGDVFEVNLSQRFRYDLPKNFSALALYEILRRVNPAPFSAFADFGEFKILSSSPERFVKIVGDQVEARPIKGTIRRSQDPTEDARLAETLKNSIKDQSENVMIVDLMRNDLSRVCMPGTIHVPKLCGLETFETVHHLVSVVQGQLKPDSTAADLFKAALPGGSITGAPKVRAMEIIYELEPNKRGIYCGNVGYIGFNGVVDMSIAIRTIIMNSKYLSYQVGGAVVLDSDSSDEYEETLVKGRPLKHAISLYGT